MSDTATAYWVAEFILRQRNISDSITNSIHLALPILSATSPPPSLRRLVLLRQLSSCQSITPKTLESIQLLHCLNPNPLASTCYLKVAAHLAVTSSDFPNNVSTLFKQRMRDIVKSMSPLAAGLVSERTKEMAEEMERAVINLELREEMIERKRMDATEAIKAFVDKEWEEIFKKPSFIEIAAAAALGKPAAEKSWFEALEIERQRLLQIANAEEQSKGTKMTGEETGENGPLGRGSPKFMSTPEVQKLLNGLKSSMAVLRKMVKDPLPDAIKIACRVSASLQCENNIDGPATNASVNDKGKNVISTRDEGVNTRSSLMDRKPTAYTYQWDDSISVESDSGNCSREWKKVRLPSPTKRAAISPLEKYQKFVRRRRQIKKWSILEEDTLRKGVKMHGRGNWKTILNCYRNIFEERTEVDLKDKWRNMTRS